MSRQLSLFEQENNGIAQVAGLTAVVRAAMNRAAAASPYSRQQIVDRMNRLAQGAGKRLTQGNAKSISLDTLDKWLSAESAHVPGLLAVEVFMRALGDTAPLSAWLALHGAELLDEEGRLYRDIGRAKMAQKAGAEQARRLEERLKEVGNR